MRMREVNVKKNLDYMYVLREKREAIQVIVCTSALVIFNNIVWAGELSGINKNDTRHKKLNNMYLIF